MCASPALTMAWQRAEARTESLFRTHVAESRSGRDVGQHPGAGSIPRASLDHLRHVASDRGEVVHLGALIPQRHLW